MISMPFLIGKFIWKDIYLLARYIWWVLFNMIDISSLECLFSFLSKISVGEYLIRRFYLAREKLHQVEDIMNYIMTSILTSGIMCNKQKILKVEE